MDSKEDYSDVDETLTIPAGYFVSRVDLDDDPPYCMVSLVNEYQPDKRFIIPKALAYFLSTHSCGSEKFRKLVENMAARHERREIRDLFDKLMEKMDLKLDFEKLIELVKKTVEEEEE